MAERLERPDQRLAVGHGEQVVAHDRLAGGGVLGGDHDQMHGGGGDDGLLAACDRGVHPVHRALVVAERERDADDRRRIGAGDRGRRGRSRTKAMDGGGAGFHERCAERMMDRTLLRSLWVWLELENRGALVTVNDPVESLPARADAQWVRVMPALFAQYRTHLFGGGRIHNR